MKTRPNEILILYHPTSSTARQTVALAHTLSTHVQEWDFSKKPLTATQWRDLLNRLDMEPKKLLDKSQSYYQEHIRGREFDDEGWLNVLIRNTDLINGPIVISGEKAILCKIPTEILGLVQKDQPGIVDVTMDAETIVTDAK